MCEECRGERKWLKDLPVDDGSGEEWECEFFEVEDDDLPGVDGDRDPDGGEGPGLQFCGEPAVALLFETMAEAHLCRECVESEGGAGGREAAAVLRAIGLEEDRVHRAIGPGETCDECGKRPATHARVITSSTPVCEVHAALGEQDG